MSSARLVAGLALAGVMGCAPAHPYYRAVGSEADAIEEAERRFAYALKTGDSGPVAPELDLAGRRAVQEAVLDLTRPGERLSGPALVLSLGVAGSALYADGAKQWPVDGAAMSAVLHAEASRIFQGEAPTDAELQAAATEEVVQPSAAKNADVGIRLAHATGCIRDPSPFSIGAGEIRRLPVRRALVPLWLAWRGGVRALHVAEMRCQDRHALLLLAEGAHGPRYLGWQLFTPTQWPAVESAIEAALR